MQLSSASHSETAEGADPYSAAPLTVLVVDDSAAQRRVLMTLLSRWGYLPHEVASAEEALHLLTQLPIDLVISDWVMPGMTGPEFCHRFRQLGRSGYGYFILLTSKSAKSEIAVGLEAGADDFVTKPVSGDELRARLRAGGRIIRMQAEVLDKNRQVEQTLQELRHLYDSLDRDLIEARKLQLTLLRDRFRAFDGAAAHLMMQPSGHIGGDLVGCFALDDRRVAVWSVDVSGHGVASAMMTARLAGYLSGAVPEQNLAFGPGPDGSRIPRSPAEVMVAFNRLMLEELQVEQYFTMVYAEVDLSSGALRLAQAGHPHPVVLRQGGGIEWLGQGGLPIGLITGAEYEDICVTLRPGDRLLLMSDGITECPDPSGQELGEEGLAQLLQSFAPLDGAELLDALVEALGLYAGAAHFPDDVSAVLLAYQGREGAPHEISVSAAVPGPAWRDPPDCQGFATHG